ncbi:MAG: hypothetical protein ACRCYV_11480 [Aeromonas sp.]
MPLAHLALLAPLALFLCTLLLYRLSPLRALAHGHVRWFVFPAFTLFILLLTMSRGVDPAHYQASQWLIPGLGFALSLFPALPKALVPRLALHEGAFAALGLMLMSLGMLF